MTRRIYPHFVSRARDVLAPDTRFFIGSTTKAFTATLVGMLVDEGRMGWDEPVEDWSGARAVRPSLSPPGVGCAPGSRPEVVR